MLKNDESFEEIAEKDERAKFNSNLSASLDIFLNRMRADQVRGKPIALDQTVQTLFKSISELHPRLLDHMHKATVIIYINI